MKKWGFRSLNYKMPFRDGAYQMDWGGDEMSGQLTAILNEGWEPFQVLVLGTSIMVFFRMCSEPSEPFQFDKEGNLKVKVV